jgi:hypothetical protein
MDSHEDDARPQNTARIRQLNDQLRVTGRGGRTVLSQAIAALPPQTLGALLVAVSEFDAFTAANDPWEEHDFGSVVVDGETYFWKIDCYDVNLEHGSPDPADEALTCRVLTLVTPGEW